MKRYAAAAAVAVAAVVVWPAAPAQAHPLGRFSVNQYAGLTLRPDRIEVDAVVDVAELPTLQDRTRADTDGDGTLSASERAGYAAAECARFAEGFTATVDGQRVTWAESSPVYEVVPGAGGLDTSRLECGLSAAAGIAASRPDGVTEARIDNGYRADRVGWREITATGTGVRLSSSTVPAESVTGRLSAYPQDLLMSALDVRTATIRVGGAPPPGSAPDANPGSTSNAADGSNSAGADPISAAELDTGIVDPNAAAAQRAGATAGPDGPGFLAAAQQRVETVLGGRLTPVVVGLAFLLAVLLGAGHAVLPGHGKTVMAAYFAGRRGRIRDALAVGGTVTLAHTGAVLLVGLLLSTSTALAGERVLAMLGVASGALVVLVGVSMLVSIRRSGTLESHTHTHTDKARRSESTHSHDLHDHDAHDHAPHHHDPHDHISASHSQHKHDSHSHDTLDHGSHQHALHDDGQPERNQYGLTQYEHSQHESAQHESAQHGSAQHGADQHGAGQHGGGQGERLEHEHAPAMSGELDEHLHGHRHGFLRGHSHGHSHVQDGRSGRLRRRLGLAGIGLAGGLVPSPSALVVLLGAIGLGRAGLGVALVIAYGLGMAATLTAVGLLLVVAQNRLGHLINTRGWASRWGGAISRISGRIATGAPTVTAALVVIVGLGIGLRALA
ncbi:hypothetical protein Aph02nite_30770 [Actinoplanes philippinensis]|uniref:ABC-type nickel/cobalt efflux system, permease component RcnA n=1 Tax=Actinoplanes philippinensis TaxID=35752 RepID=A0A1I2EBH9_9ACTN|nr:High-affinity nickel-transporter [Actinoplanes philippinensis]GIE77127.1 hypothetical protein Aph02nite_30770 [Actinoplanes philippinensis]SFE90059.1 hypothetical protein SAMN05421541_104328 [Actinoplanes philippinensis]